MKTHDKITWLFTALTGSLLLIIFLSIYYFVDHYKEKEFYQRLQNRTDIAAEWFFEQDDIQSHLYEDVLKKHLQILPEENEEVIPVNLAEKTLLVDNSSGYPQKFIDKIFLEGLASWKINEKYYSGKLYSESEGDFIVVVSAIDVYGQTKLIFLRKILIVSFLLGIVFIYLMGSNYSGKVLEPISKIAEKANSISVSNLHLRLDTDNSKDELSELADTFNRMLDRLQASFEIQNNFVNNASHELRNPITAVLGMTEITLQKERKPEEYTEALIIVQKEAERLELLVNSLLKLARAGSDKAELNFQSLRIDELLMDVKMNIDIMHPENKVVFDFTGWPDEIEPLIIQGNENLLQVALNNILDNACKFSMNEQVIIRLRPSKQGIHVFIKDQGVGIPESGMDNITVPFYRAPNARSFRGFGVGLPLAQRIIKLHNGRMEVFSKELQGTEVVVSLPNQKES